MKNSVIDFNNCIKYFRIIFILIPFLLLGTLIIGKESIFHLASLFPQCISYRLFHLYCPSCGNTRCVLSLLQGNLLSALRYNITPVVLCILLFLLYIEGLTYSFQKHIKLLPRNYFFWYCVMGFMAVYYIVRNIIDFMPLS